MKFSDDKGFVQPWLYVHYVHKRIPAHACGNSLLVHSKHNVADLILQNPLKFALLLMLGVIIVYSESKESIFISDLRTCLWKMLIFLITLTSFLYIFHMTTWLCAIWLIQ